ATQVPLGTYVTVKQGDRLAVGVLTVTMNAIVSRTAEGCQGGPIGCPDTVELTVTGAGITQEITLAVLGGSQQTASSERIVLGHRFVLASVGAGSANMAVFIAEQPTTQPTPSQ
ncbi:MAG: hypothetical protein Q8P82_01685, partial [bacterium]|nr:hypothetical protein [bacterium]